MQTNTMFLQQALGTKVSRVFSASVASGESLFEQNRVSLIMGDKQLINMFADSSALRTNHHNIDKIYAKYNCAACACTCIYIGHSYVCARVRWGVGGEVCGVSVRVRACVCV